VSRDARKKVHAALERPHRRRRALWRGGARLSAQERFYIGEVVYRGEVHRGEHEPIVNSTLFEAVQGKLAAQAVALRCRLRGSPTLLSGRLFDNREFNYGR